METAVAQESPEDGSKFAFMAKLYRQLEPLYTDPFTKQTEQARNLLLVASLVLFLLAFGVMKLDNPQKGSIFHMEIVTDWPVRWVVIAIVAYLLISFHGRATADWQLFEHRLTLCLAAIMQSSNDLVTRHSAFVAEEQRRAAEMSELTASGAMSKSQRRDFDRLVENMAASWKLRAQDDGHERQQALNQEVSRVVRSTKRRRLLDIRFPVTIGALAVLLGAVTAIT